MNDYYNNMPPVPGSREASMSVDQRVSAAMKKVYFKMFLALLVTAFTSMFCASSQAYLQFFTSNTWFMWFLIIAEFGLVIGLSSGINKLSSGTATFLFYMFALVNGMMLFTIFFAYSTDVIYKTFFITAGVFGAMSIYGYFTNRDLSKMGTYLIMALIGLIIASVVNIFLKSSQLDWIISIIGVLLFVGLTAWDTQQIKTMAQYSPDSTTTSRLATIGALSLYLDFINLFLYLLRIFGNRR